MCNCEDCEQWMQPYMDRVLTDAERTEAETHLDECAYCRKRYKFEEHLRQYVRQVVVVEPMPTQLKEKLSALRTPLQ